MWFKDIEKWSQKKLKLNFLFYGLIYFSMALVAPIVIVGCKYDLIKSSATKLTGVGMILAICVGVFLFRILKKLLNKLPQETKKEQIYKYIFLMIYSLMIPAFGIMVLQLIKQNVDLACDTLTWCLGFICGSIVLDHLALKFLEAEWDLRQEAKHQIEVNKRVETLRK